MIGGGIGKFEVGGSGGGIIVLVGYLEVFLVEVEVGLVVEVLVVVMGGYLVVEVVVGGYLVVEVVVGGYLVKVLV